MLWVEFSLPKKDLLESWFPVPQIVTLFSYRVFSEARRSSGWAPTQYDWSPYKKGKCGHRYAHTGRTQPSTRREVWHRALPQPSKGTNPANTLILDFYPPKLCNNKLMFKPLSLWYFAALANLYRWEKQKRLESGYCHHPSKEWWWFRPAVVVEGVKYFQILDIFWRQSQKDFAWIWGKKS